MRIGERQEFLSWIRKLSRDVEIVVFFFTPMLDTSGMKDFFFFKTVHFEIVCGNGSKKYTHMYVIDQDYNFTWN